MPGIIQGIKTSENLDVSQAVMGLGDSERNRLHGVHAKSTDTGSKWGGLRGLLGPCRT